MELISRHAREADSYHTARRCHAVGVGAGGPDGRSGGKIRTLSIAFGPTRGSARPGSMAVSRDVRLFLGGLYEVGGRCRRTALKTQNRHPHDKKRVKSTLKEANST